MIQVVQQTRKEKVKMYMKCKKKQLAKMLAERDEVDATRPPIVYPYYTGTIQSDPDTSFDWMKPDPDVVHDGVFFTDRKTGETGYCSHEVSTITIHGLNN